MNNAFRRYYSECENYKNIEEKSNKTLHRFFLPFVNGRRSWTKITI